MTWVTTMTWAKALLTHRCNKCSRKLFSRYIRSHNTACTASKFCFPPPLSQKRVFSHPLFWTPHLEISLCCLHHLHSEVLISKFMKPTYLQQQHQHCNSCEKQQRGSSCSFMQRKLTSVTFWETLLWMKLKKWIRGLCREEQMCLGLPLKHKE